LAATGGARKPEGVLPILFRIPGLGWPVHSFGVMLALAFLAGMVRLDRYARDIGLDRQRVSDIAVWIVFAAIVGCRVLYFVVHPDQLFVRSGGSIDWLKSLFAFFAVWKGGMVFYGGFVLASLTAIWKSRQYRLPILRLLDLTAVSLFLGMFIGRWGCLLVGDDYGKPVDCSAWYALRLPNPLPEGSLFPRGVECLHPTQIYMSLNGLFLFTLGAWLLKRQRAWGTTTCVILATYSVTRSLIETVRGDGEARGWVIPDTLSTSQAISIPVFLIGVTGLLVLRACRESGPVFARARAEAVEKAARESA
jgi:phosphatidylglycerol:prolipoprotein diacylglycerol transferase